MNDCQQFNFFYYHCYNVYSNTQYIYIYRSSKTLLCVLLVLSIFAIGVALEFCSEADNNHHPLPEQLPHIQVKIFQIYVKVSDWQVFSLLLPSK
mgnify:CR=1 FL=1